MAIRWSDDDARRLPAKERVHLRVVGPLLFEVTFADTGCRTYLRCATRSEAKREVMSLVPYAIFSQ